MGPPACICTVNQAEVSRERLRPFVLGEQVSSQAGGRPQMLGCQGNLSAEDTVPVALQRADEDALDRQVLAGGRRAPAASSLPTQIQLAAGMQVPACRRASTSVSNRAGRKSSGNWRRSIPSTLEASKRN